ncbi:hypothetical protein [Nocardia sp. NPDC050710]|uniref:hypothetical protein n=1 Tax=Nocardia sp. NPDC050710 TaxID=3157220 RepID=UPI0033C3ABAA
MSSTTYRQPPTEWWGGWFCLLAGLVFSGVGIVVVLSALPAVGASDDRAAALYGLALGLLWCGIGGGGLWVAREIRRATARLVITPDGLIHSRGGFHTGFAWSEIALIRVIGGSHGQLVVIPGLLDPYTIDAAELRTSTDAIMATIRHYCPTLTIGR